MTRSSDQASRLSDRLRAEGLDPFEVALTEVRVSDDHRSALDSVVEHLDRFAWVALTSPNAVAVFVSSMRQVDSDPSVLRLTPRFAAVGPGTAEAIRASGWEPALVATTSSGQGLLEAMRSLDPATVLLPVAAAARPTLADGLRMLGWNVTRVVVYETWAVQPSGELLAGASECNAIAFASSSSVDAWASAWVGELRGRKLSDVTPRLVSIGPQTSLTAREHGLDVVTEANPHTLDGLALAVAWVLRGE